MQFTVSVTDSIGKPVAGLQRSDFEVRAGGQTLPIEYFHEEPDGAPTSIVIVMDLSGLMAADLVPHLSKVEAVQKSLPDAMATLNGCDEIAILAFGGSELWDEQTIGQTPNRGPYQDLHETPIRLLQPFTTDHRLALMRLPDRRAYGLAPLYDAIQQGLNMLESAHYQNRALVVITDGVDDTSSIKKEDLIASINQSRVPVYAIELGEPNTRAYAPPSGLVITIPIPFPGKTANTATGKTTPKKKTACEKFKCVDTEVLEKLTAPNGGQLLIVPHATYDSSVTLKDELNSTMTSLSHGYSIGVIAPAGSVRPEIAVTNRRNVKLRAHVVHGSQ